MRRRHDDRRNSHDLFLPNSVDEWIGRGIVADLFIAPAANEVIGLHAFVPPGHGAGFWRATQPCCAVDTYREVTARTETGDVVEIGAVRGADRRNLQFVGGGEREKMRRVLLRRRRCHRDGKLRPPPWRAAKAMSCESEHRRGMAALRVAGVYYDYTSDHGLIMIDR